MKRTIIDFFDLFFCVFLWRVDIYKLYEKESGKYHLDFKNLKLMTSLFIGRIE